VAVGAVGLFDQTAPACQTCLDTNAAADQTSRTFVAEIERTLAPRAAVYQIPYMPFPEVPPRHALGAYDQAVGFLDSRHLRWSYGCIKGRECARFFEALDHEPLETQLAVIRRLGFSGIYLDKRGYEDNGAAAITELRRLLGVDPIERDDGQVAFFTVDGASDPDNTPRKPGRIMRQAEYYVAADGPRYAGSFEEGIDFRRDGWPSFVKAVSGVSAREPWGRWSDARLAPSVTIKLRDPLPRKFSLILEAVAFRRNVGEDIAIRIGEFHTTVQLQDRASEIVVPVRLANDKVKSIEILPPHATKPPSGDPRQIGIGLVSLRIVPTDAGGGAAD
jgi:phosphoglycerol transferase